MFEAAELGRSVPKDEYKKQVPELRAQLLQAQLALQETNTPVIIIIGGVDGAGRGEVINLLHEWLDPRWLEASAFGNPSDEERERPRYWRFWRALPGRGKIGIMFGGWYLEPIRQHIAGETELSRFDHQLKRIQFFEKMLVDDGAVILKFWLHLSKDGQRKRLKKLSKNPFHSWRVSKEAKENLDHYDRIIEVSERAIRFSDTGVAPWVLVESEDTRYRDLTVGMTLLEALNRRLEAHRQGEPRQAPMMRRPEVPTANVTILDHVDLTQHLDDETYKKKLTYYQAKLHRLAQEAYDNRISTVVVYEGSDAGGKGGNIRRMTAAMDARHYQVIPIAAPTDEERAHHYLWRFWRHIPRRGKVTIYDRSWYGRVLVERVEGFAKEHEWSRAYLEINEFEEQLTEHGVVLIKFWLHIDKDEQLRRFKEREQVAYKQHKITDEDWRNREKWDDYVAAVNDMVAHTSTTYSPWTIIAGNDKKFARIQALQTVCDRLDKALHKVRGTVKEPELVLLEEKLNGVKGEAEAAAEGGKKDKKSKKSKK
ncbi:polyphosphate:AMP phosphotransferase [Endothiovibrio diazotrophicus]